MCTCRRETKKMRKHSPMGHGHTTVPSPPFLSLLRILGMTTQSPDIFLKYLGLGLKQCSQSFGKHPPNHHATEWLQIVGFNMLSKWRPHNVPFLLPSHTLSSYPCLSHPFDECINWDLKQENEALKYLKKQRINYIGHSRTEKLNKEQGKNSEQLATARNHSHYQCVLLFSLNIRNCSGSIQDIL